MSNEQALGARIRQAREAHGYTQARLGELTGLRPEQVSRYEHGAVRPGLEALSRIADHTGVTVDWLANGRGDGPPSDESTGGEAA